MLFESHRCAPSLIARRKNGIEKIMTAAPVWGGATESRPILRQEQSI
jgi:hypothetical protein